MVLKSSNICCLSSLTCKEVIVVFENSKISSLSIFRMKKLFSQRFWFDLLASQRSGMKFFQVVRHSYFMIFGRYFNRYIERGGTCTKMELALLSSASRFLSLISEDPIFMIMFMMYPLSAFFWSSGKMLHLCRTASSRIINEMNFVLLFCECSRIVSVVNHESASFWNSFRAWFAKTI